MPLIRTAVRSPVDPLHLAIDADGALCALAFHNTGRDGLDRHLARHHSEAEVTDAPPPGRIAAALADYFDGALDALDGLVVASRGTPFQRSVWAALRTIPAGTTTAYGAMATALGRPGASRAVGLANGANPVAIVCPCHRIVGANGTLTGFGGELWRKRWLLEHEARHSGLFAAHSVAGAGATDQPAP